MREFKFRHLLDAQLVLLQLSTQQIKFEFERKSSYFSIKVSKDFAVKVLPVIKEYEIIE